MARYSQQETPLPDWTPTQAVPEPVINKPYDEPQKHWSYKDGAPFEVPGRRPAMYWYQSKRLTKGTDLLWAEEERDPLPLVAIYGCRFGQRGYRNREREFEDGRRVHRSQRTGQDDPRDTGSDRRRKSEAHTLPASDLYD